MFNYTLAKTELELKHKAEEAITQYIRIRYPNIKEVKLFSVQHFNCRTLVCFSSSKKCDCYKEKLKTNEIILVDGGATND